MSIKFKKNLQKYQQNPIIQHFEQNTCLGHALAKIDYLFIKPLLAINFEVLHYLNYERVRVQTY